MLYGNERSDLRRAYVDAWSKSRAGQPLEPHERRLADVIVEHPEYHAVLESPDALDLEFPPEAGRTNPFLHMGLHIAVREQLATDRPRGMRRIYTKLRPRFSDVHQLEHALMECLAEMIWETQRKGIAPNEAQYLSRVQRLAVRPAR